MKKYIADILGNPKIAKYVINFKEYFITSKFNHTLQVASVKLSSDKEFIVRNTEWLFIDNFERAWGVLGEHVVYINKSMEIKYACEGFEGILEYYNNIEKDVISFTKEQASLDLVDYNEALRDYYLSLDSNNIVPIFVLEEEKFKTFVKKKK